MSRSVNRSADLTVALPKQRAMELFTPEGERAWAGDHGWDPKYPDAERSRGAGAVFTTRAGDRESIWVMVDDTDDRKRYARITLGGLAGTVEVAAVRGDGEATSVRVTYDMTALSDDAVAELEAFVARFEATIASWGTAIAAASRG
jgi:hypothetical protein